MASERWIFSLTGGSIVSFFAQIIKTLNFDLPSQNPENILELHHGTYYLGFEPVAD
ncbi:hypothetical protein [Agrobacterium vaccinii]|uniref:hypothetical protein n=1 Tax=Agrobacterium vaccinii TaxID=2735528 RepID=UPI001E5B68E0|nr:hypothetical protein [Agrobacterium vaccinii]